MKKLFMVFPLLLLFAASDLAAAEKPKDYIFRGMPGGYELGDQKF